VSNAEQIKGSKQNNAHTRKADKGVVWPWRTEQAVKALKVENGGKRAVLTSVWVGGFGWVGVWVGGWVWVWGVGVQGPAALHSALHTHDGLMLGPYSHGSVPAIAQRSR
jgi:hypothetical protein